MLLTLAYIIIYMPSMGEVIHDSAYFWNAKENSHIIESNI